MTDTIAQPASHAASRQRIADTWEHEGAITKRLLRAYPADQAELRPHEKSKTARELAWMFTVEAMGVAAGVRGKFDLMAGGGFPPVPDTWDAVVQTFERTLDDLVEAVRGCSDEQLGGTVNFFIGPGQMGPIPVEQFVWFLLHDHIHHRGQLSVYLRMAGGKVPSIYGPTADEPWR